MKNKIFNFLLLFALLICVTACGKTTTIDKIVKNINNSTLAKSYKENGCRFLATSTSDTIKIDTKIGNNKLMVKFHVKGDIISNENLSTQDLMLAFLVLDSVGQIHGYQKGELSQNLNAFPEEFKKYTLEKEGLEITLNGDNTSIKIDYSKKIPLIDMDNYYLTTDDFDIVRQILADKENGNQSGKSGNIAYDVFIGDTESTIKIGQEGKLSSSAYKSILSALEVMYGEDVAKHFQEIYPKFVDGKKTIESFTIETDYKDENQDESVFKDTKVVLVTIRNDLKK
ncbi:MAG: hypothetical protein IKE70_02930 [Bacilli bacterium]|nr:hypothetical protein [Bacilli bacterium]